MTGSDGVVRAAAPGELVRGELAACVVGATLLSLLDVLSCALRPLQPAWPGLLGIIAAGIPLGAALPAIALVPRRLLAERAPLPAPARGALVGLLDGLGLFLLFVVAHDPRTLEQPNARAAVLAAACAGGALTGWLRVRLVAPRPWLLRACALAVGLTAAVIAWGLRWHEAWPRLALDLTFTTALAALLAPWLRRVRPRVVAGTGVALATLGAAAAGVLAPALPAMRLALHHRSTHVKSWLYVLERAFLLEGGHAWAARAPTASVVPPVSRRRHGAARGADVLLLSVDSLRWDAVRWLTEVRGALGAHVDFRFALSPAPSTRDSLASLLRGRPVRQLRVERVARAHDPVLWRDPSPTLGHVLLTHGYRSVTFPTSNIGDPRLGVQLGFDTIWIANHDAAARGRPVALPALLHARAPGRAGDPARRAANPRAAPALGPPHGAPRRLPLVADRRGAAHP